MIKLTLRVAALLSVAATAPVHAQTDDLSRLFALNVFHEARSQGEEGMRAVAHVVVNRVESDMFPNDPRAVIVEGCEFKWYCDGRSDQPGDDPLEQQAWQLAQEVAADFVNGSQVERAGEDLTDGGLWFHEDFLPMPSFLAARERSAHIQDHYFYR